MTRTQFQHALKELIQEESSSGAAGGYTGKFAFNPNKNATGTSKNYYLKMGYKLVDQKKLRKQAKGMVYKDLWK